MLTEVHAPGDPHSQQSRPLRRRQSVSVAHLEITGSCRMSNASQRPAVQRAPRKGCGAGRQGRHGGGTGHTAWRNCERYLALTPTKPGRSATPHGSQHPLYSGVHSPGPPQALQSTLPPPAPPLPVVVVLPVVLTVVELDELLLPPVPPLETSAPASSGP